MSCGADAAFKVIRQFKTKNLNGKGPALLLFSNMFNEVSKSLLFEHPKVTIFMLYMHMHKLKYPVFLLEMNAGAIRVNMYSTTY